MMAISRRDCISALMNRNIILNCAQISYKCSNGYYDRILMILLGGKCPGALKFLYFHTPTLMMPPRSVAVMALVRFVFCGLNFSSYRC
jgi:hypothetical protein